MALSNYRCIILIGCTSGEKVYARMPLPNPSPAYDFFVNNIGNVLEVNIGAPFTERYYSFELCNLAPIVGDCQACADANDDGSLYTFLRDPVTDLPINVTTTGSNVCPAFAYLLVNCNYNGEYAEPLDELIQSPSTVLVTNSDLNFYVGSTINISQYPDNCYTVFGPYVSDTGCPCPEYTVTNSYKDCECCIPDPPKKYEPRILDPVKIFYRILQSQCDIKANIRFSEGYYKYFKHVAYGMGICCDNIDLDKLWMKKELSDLNQIYDPTACVKPPDPPDPLICE